jgi:hypothetical protein
VAPRRIAPVTSIGATGPICSNSDRATAVGFNSLCLQANTNSPGTISLQNYGTAPAESIIFNINGASQGFPTVSPLPVVTGNLACFGTTGGGLTDCGKSPTSLFANPTATVGLTAVNGSATTAMRSDAAPPLSASVQSALTGTNNRLLFGTGAFGFSATSAPVRAGDIAYFNGSTWVILPGNNSGAQILPENPSGVPAWTASGTGNVTGPGSSTNGDIVTFNGTGGTSIQDGGGSAASFPVIHPSSGNLACGPRSRAS